MQPPPGWTAGVDDATNKIIQQTEARRRAYVAATTSALGSPPALLSEQNFADDVASHSTPPQPELGVGVTEPPPPPPAPPLEATPEDEPPQQLSKEMRLARTAPAISALVAGRLKKRQECLCGLDLQH
jgi:hypothetical protein